MFSLTRTTDSVKPHEEKGSTFKLCEWVLDSGLPKSHSENQIFSARVMLYWLIITVSSLVGPVISVAISQLCYLGMKATLGNAYKTLGNACKLMGEALFQ